MVSHSDYRREMAKMQLINLIDYFHTHGASAIDSRVFGHYHEFTETVLRTILTEVEREENV